MTMPKFEAVAWRYELKAGEYTFAEKRYFDEAYVQRVIALHTAEQLAGAYEAGKLEQAAQIEMMREALEACYNGLRWWMDAFPMHVTEADNEEMLKLVKTLSTTPDQALEQFSAKVREQCQMTCLEKHANGNWKYDTREECAEAISSIKELP